MRFGQITRRREPGLHMDIRGGTCLRSGKFFWKKEQERVAELEVRGTTGVDPTVSWACCGKGPYSSENMQRSDVTV